MTSIKTTLRDAVWKRMALGAAVIVLIATAYLLYERFSAAPLVDWLRSVGPWAPLLYMLVFLIAPVLFLPGAPITIAGGALFGPVWGTVYSVAAATAGASLAFQISRHLAGEWVERNAAGIVRRLKRGIEEEGWRFVAFTRLVPLFPFNVLNYGYGLTRVKFGHYLLASFFCMIPGAAAYSVIGYAGREAVLGGSQPLLKISTAVGLMLFLSMLPRFIVHLRKPPESRS